MEHAVIGRHIESKSTGDPQELGRYPVQQTFAFSGRVSALEVKELTYVDRLFFQIGRYRLREDVGSIGELQPHVSREEHFPFWFPIDRLFPGNQVRRMALLVIVDQIDLVQGEDLAGRFHAVIGLDLKGYFPVLAFPVNRARHLLLLVRLQESAIDDTPGNLRAGHDAPDDAGASDQQQNDQQYSDRLRTKHTDRLSVSEDFLGRLKNRLNFEGFGFRGRGANRVSREALTDGLDTSPG